MANVKCSNNKVAEAYKEYVKQMVAHNKKLNINEEDTQKKINVGWATAPMLNMTAKEKDVFKYITGTKSGLFTFSYGDSTKQDTAQVINITSTDDTTTVVLADGKEYTFVNESLYSNKTQSGKTVRSPAVALATGPRLIYGSTEDGLSITKDHEELKVRLHESQEEALGLFDRLTHAEGDSEHNAELRETLTSIVDKSKRALNEFRVFINTKADKNGGLAVVSGKNPALFLNVADGSQLTTGMSVTEAYVHEMIHMSVEAAMQFKSHKVYGPIKDMLSLYEQAAAVIKWQDIKEDWMSDQQAKDRYNYIFANKNGKGLSEFIAYGMTNKTFKAELHKIKPEKAKTPRAERDQQTLWGKISTKLIEMYDLLSQMIYDQSTKGKQVDDVLGQLVTKLQEHNNLTVDKSGFLNKVKAVSEYTRAKADDTLLMAVKGLAGYMGDGLDMVENVTGETFVGKGIKTTRNAFKWASPFLTEKELAARAHVARIFEKKFESWGIGKLFAQEGTLMNLMNYINEDDADTIKVEKFGLLMQQMDARREDRINAVGGNLTADLGKPGEKQQRALTNAVMDVDLKALHKDYGMKNIENLLASDTEVDKAIEKTRADLKAITTDEKVFNYYASQAMGLGSYLVNHIGSSSLNMNAYDIVTMRSMSGAYDRLFIAENKNDKDGSINANKIKLVDQLATLEAIKRTGKHHKDMALEIMKTNSVGVENLMMQHRIHENDNIMFKKQYGVHDMTIKGEVKDLKADWKDYKLAPLDKEAKMKKDGYLLRGNSGVEGIGIYVTNTSGAQKFDKQAIAKINTNKHMQNLVGIKNLHNEATPGEKRKAVSQHMKQLITDAAIDLDQQLSEIKMPVMNGYMKLDNKDGEVKNFAVTVDKEIYEEAVSQDRRAPIVMAKMVAEIQEKAESTTQNNKVLRDIELDMSKNYLKRGEDGKNNNREYIEIGPDATNTGLVKTKFSKEIWENLPASIKSKVAKRGKDKRFIAVRRDLAYMYFGVRAPSLLESRIPFTETSAAKLLDDNGMGAVKRKLQLAGDIWEEMIGLQKTDVVIKTPAVIRDNIISNINYSAALGQPIWEVADQQAKMFKYTKEYLDQKKERLKLTDKLRIENAKGKELSREDKIRIKSIDESMSRNPVKPLMDAGLFSSVMEDLSMKDMLAPTRIDEAFGKYTENIPQIIRDGAKTLWITQDTPLFQAMTMTVQYSDFVARANRYHFLLDQGYPHNTALKMIVDEFTNYNRAQTPFIKGLTQKGIVKFLQYFLGSNKNAFNKMKTRPASMVALNSMDIASPFDAFALNKDFSYTTNINPLVMGWDDNKQYLMPASALEALGF